MSRTVSPSSVAEPGDEVGEGRGLLRVHPRRRLVQEDQLRLGRKGARDLEAALVPVGEIAGELWSRPLRPENSSSSRARFRASRSSRLTLGVWRTLPRIPLFSRECMPTSVFSRAVMLWKRRMFWKVRPMPRCVIACGGFAGDVLAAQHDAPGGRLVDAREHVEERRLARSVRADQAHDRLLRDLEVDVVDREEAPELLPQPSTISRSAITSSRRRAARRGRLPRTRPSASHWGSVPQA